MILVISGENSTPQMMSVDKNSNYFKLNAETSDEKQEPKDQTNSISPLRSKSNPSSCTSTRSSFDGKETLNGNKVNKIVKNDVTVFKNRCLLVENLKIKSRLWLYAWYQNNVSLALSYCISK